MRNLGVVNEFGPVHSDKAVVSNGIVVLLAINTLLLGLYQEGHIRPGALIPLVLLMTLSLSKIIVSVRML